MERLGRELLEIRRRLELGGGAERIRRQRERGKLTARDRISHLLDPGATWAEVGLLVAHDRYEGEAPAAGVVTGVGVVEGREVVVVANDATVKAGSWWPDMRVSAAAATLRTTSSGVRSPISYMG